MLIEMTVTNELYDIKMALDNYISTISIPIKDLDEMYVYGIFSHLTGLMGLRMSGYKELVEQYATKSNDKEYVEKLIQNSFYFLPIKYITTAAIDNYGDRRQFLFRLFKVKENRC